MARYHNTGTRPNRPAREASPEPIAKETFTAEDKEFSIELHENQRGRFIKFTEFANGRRDRIMIPIAGMADAQECLRRIAEYAEKNP